MFKTMNMDTYLQTPKPSLTLSMSLGFYVNCAWWITSQTLVVPIVSMKSSMWVGFFLHKMLLKTLNVMLGVTFLWWLCRLGVWTLLLNNGFSKKSRKRRAWIILWFTVLSCTLVMCSKRDRDCMVFFPFPFVASVSFFGYNCLCH